MNKREYAEKEWEQMFFRNLLWDHIEAAQKKKKMSERLVQARFNSAIASTRMAEQIRRLVS